MNLLDLFLFMWKQLCLITVMPTLDHLQLTRFWDNVNPPVARISLRRLIPAFPEEQPQQEND